MPELFEVSIINKKGEEVPIEITGASTMYNGKPANVVYIRDINERKQVEAKLKQYQEHLEKLVANRTNELIVANEKLEIEIEQSTKTEEEVQFILDNIPVYVVLKDRTGRYLRVNKPTQLTNPEKEFVGKTIYDIIPNQAYCDFETSDDRIVVDTGQPLEIIFKSDLILSKGKSWFKYCRVPHKDRNGNVDCFVLLAINITDIKLAEEKIQKLYKSEKKLRSKLEKQMDQRRDFIKAMVHELKTPLTPLLASVELITAESQQEPLSSLAREAYNGANYINKRIDELFDISRGEIGVLKLKYHNLNPTLVLQEAFDYMKAGFTKSGRNLKLETAANLPTIWADKERLHQILLNLLNNALKFTPEGSETVLRAYKENNDIKFEIQDSGPGISIKRQGDLFKTDVHYKSRKQPNGGLGLGLILCRTLVELHGGHIWIKSKCGSGSTFIFTIPINRRMVNLNNKSK